MKLSFFKYQATGNDFIIVDDRKRTFDLQNSSLIQRLCNRRFGIGADGLIVYRPEQGFDFRMFYYNADGYEGSMCGNGGRCIAAFAHQLEPAKNTFEFIAFDGPHSAKIIGITDEACIVKLKMQDVEQPKARGTDFLINTGSPHYVSFVSDAGSIDVVAEGRRIRNSPQFIREGVNVNFAESHQDSITVRTYERGVEDETLSCGTGITATAIAAHFSGLTKKKELVFFTRGGELRVNFEVDSNRYINIFLTGQAMQVFEGSIEL